jgi:Cys-rich protein (TIGR01571 family)
VLLAIRGTRNAGALFCCVTKSPNPTIFRKIALMAPKIARRCEYCDEKHCNGASGCAWNAASARRLQDKTKEFKWAQFAMRDWGEATCGTGSNAIVTDENCRRAMDAYQTVCHHEPSGSLTVASFDGPAGCHVQIGDDGKGGSKMSWQFNTNLGGNGIGERHPVCLEPTTASEVTCVPLSKDAYSGKGGSKCAVVEGHPTDGSFKDDGWEEKREERKGGRRRRGDDDNPNEDGFYGCTVGGWFGDAQDEFWNDYRFLRAYRAFWGVMLVLYVIGFFVIGHFVAPSQIFSSSIMCAYHHAPVPVVSQHPIETQTDLIVHCTVAGTVSPTCEFGALRSGVHASRGPCSHSTRYPARSQASASEVSRPCTAACASSTAAAAMSRSAWGCGRATVRAHQGRLSALSVLLCKYVFYGAFVWARRALHIQKRRFPARAGLRRHMQIPGGFGQDCLIHCCAHSCAMCQEMRELELAANGSRTPVDRVHNVEVAARSQRDFNPMMPAAGLASAAAAVPTVRLVTVTCPPGCSPGRVISDCHFAVQLNQFIPSFQSYPVHLAVCLK